jgi:hypothetical protein
MKNSITTPLDKPIFDNQEDAEGSKNSWRFKIGLCRKQIQGDNQERAHLTIAQRTGGPQRHINHRKNPFDTDTVVSHRVSL